MISNLKWTLDSFASPKRLWSKIDPVFIRCKLPEIILVFLINSCLTLIHENSHHSCLTVVPSLIDKINYILTYVILLL